ncbi:MAG: bifunctional phosphoribosylaminoimidazolecarboxamide formyltransferase/IMP cyclohydrolase [Candidatus Abyssubacteria bacterium]
MKKKDKKRALFSLYDQEHAATYARELVDLGWEIVATKETYDLLTQEGIRAKNFCDFLKVEDKYPFPPTLHPDIELALTSDRGQTIDLVYVTNYPLSVGNDVGGHTLLGLAAKGGRIVVYCKEDMRKVVDDLKQNNNICSSLLLKELCENTNAKIASHYASLVHDPRKAKAVRTTSLLNGENPYQVPATHVHVEAEDPLSLGNFRQVSGVVPCFTNMADFDSILQAMCALHQAFADYYGRTPNLTIAAKHGNACGMGADWTSAAVSVGKALWGNARAIWGGEVITNFRVTREIAELLYASRAREEALGDKHWNLDVLVAPGFDASAIELLGRRKNLKVFENGALAAPKLSEGIWAYRMVRGGYLRQPPNNYVLDLSGFKVGSADLEASQIDSLIIAWATAWFSSHGGNEVAIASDRKLLGVGGGPATVDACETAVNRAMACGHELGGSVFAADAFFPFTDGPEVLVNAGCVCGLAPGGGKNFPLIRAFFEDNDVRVYYLPEEIRGFCRH